MCNKVIFIYLLMIRGDVKNGRAIFTKLGAQIARNTICNKWVDLDTKL